MNIVLVTGTQVNGATQRIKSFFTEELSDGNVIQEFVLLRDAPAYCTGCKTCIFRDEHHCPHADKVKSLSLKLIDHSEWDLITPSRRARIESKTRYFARRFRAIKPARRNIKHHFVFAMCRSLQRRLLQKNGLNSADLRYWVSQGWISSS